MSVFCWSCMGRHDMPGDDVITVGWPENTRLCERRSRSVWWWLKHPVVEVGHGHDDLAP